MTAAIGGAAEPAAGVEDALVAATRLLEGARRAQIPVVHTRVVFSADDLATPFVRKVDALSLFMGETEAGQIAAPLTPRSGETVLDKQGAGGFHGTGLDTLLREDGVDTVLIAGLSTSGCVRATAVDAVQLGYTPVVVREAVGDRASGPHEAALFDLDAKYADVVGLDEVLGHLASTAPAPAPATSPRHQEEIHR